MWVPTSQTRWHRYPCPVRWGGGDAKIYFRVTLLVPRWASKAVLCLNAEMGLTEVVCDLAEQGWALKAVL